MRLNDPEIRDLLAAEYVLGTLRGAARRRFERLRYADADLRRRVDAWSEKLDRLGEAAMPVRPPAHVWENIQRRLGLIDEAPSHTGGGFWRGLALAASIAFVAVSLYFTQVFEPAVAPSYVAVISDKQARGAWLVKTSEEGRRISVQSLQPSAITPEQAYELWLLPGAGQAPRSMGLLPTSGTVVLNLDQGVYGALPAADGLAVSLEPAGGSPTGLPTGPVLYQGKILSL